MAWATPRTWVSGDNATAAQFNQDMRDNPNYLAALDSANWGWWYAYSDTLIMATNVAQVVSFSSIFGTTAGAAVSQSTGTAITIPEVGVYLMSESLSGDTVDAVMACNIRRAGVVIDGSYIATQYKPPSTHVGAIGQSFLASLAAAVVVSMGVIARPNAASMSGEAQFSGMRVS